MAVTSLEFFYAEAPSTVRGVSAGLNLLTTALGSWITVPLLTLVRVHTPFGGVRSAFDRDLGFSCSLRKANTTYQAFFPVVAVLIVGGRMMRGTSVCGRAVGTKGDMLHSLSASDALPLLGGTLYDVHHVTDAVLFSDVRGDAEPLSSRAYKYVFVFAPRLQLCTISTAVVSAGMIGQLRGLR